MNNEFFKYGYYTVLCFDDCENEETEIKINKRKLEHICNDDFCRKSYTRVIKNNNNISDINKLLELKIIIKKNMKLTNSNDKTNFFIFNKMT